MNTYRLRMGRVVTVGLRDQRLITAVVMEQRNDDSWRNPHDPIGVSGTFQPR